MLSVVFCMAMTAQDETGLFSALQDALAAGSEGRCHKEEITGRSRLIDYGGFGDKARNTLRQRLEVKGLPSDPYLDMEALDFFARQITVSEVMEKIKADYRKLYCGRRRPRG
jgi:hypothetical protein